MKKIPSDVKSVVKIHKMLKSANHIYLGKIFNLVYEFYETNLETFLKSCPEMSN